MKKVGLNIFIWFMLILCINSISALRISEVEANPSGSDSGNEWVELYSEVYIDLTGYKLINYDNDESYLNESFVGYFIKNLSGQWLDNTNESVRLFNENTLIDSTIIFSDSYNEKTLQYCDGNWNFKDLTKGFANLCNVINQTQNQTQNNTSQNQSQQNNTPQNQTVNLDIYLELDWQDDELINGKEFEIKVKAFNLKDENYDLKIYITFENNNTIISDRYDNENNEWKSGTYYISSFFQGPGNETKDVSLKIREDYSDFSDDAVLVAKLRDGTETSESIEILEVEKDNSNVDTNSDSQSDNQQTYNYITETQETQNQKVIYLNKKSNNSETEDLKTEKILYESETGRIKKYALYGFAGLCIIFIMVLLLKRK